jgi:hypothetical protein
MQWLDREFWNLYKRAVDTRPDPPSTRQKLNQSCSTSSHLDSASDAAAGSTNDSVPIASEWSPDEQRRLEAALVTHSSSLEPKLRWRLIAADVGSKTAGQCIARFKFIRDTLKSGGSVAAAEAKAAAASTARDTAALVNSATPASCVPVRAAAASAASAASAAAAAAASDSPMNMPPIEMPDDLLTMTGVMAGAGMCAGGFNFNNISLFPLVKLKSQLI